MSDVSKRKGAENAAQIPEEQPAPLNTRGKPSPKWLRIIITAYTLFLILITLTLTFLLQAVLYVPTTLFLAVQQREQVLGHIFRFMSAFVVWLNPFWRIKVHGKKCKLPRSALVMCNHLSNADPWFMCAALFPWETKYLSKASLLSVPIGGWAMRLAGDIPIYFTKEKGGWRVRPEDAAKTDKRIRTLLELGQPISVFPEGVRSKDGRMASFRHGIFKLAVETGTEVVPMAIRGAQDAWPVGDGLLDKCEVHYKCGEPLKPKENEDFQEFKGRVRKAIIELMETLPGEGYEHEEQQKKDD